MTTVAAEQQTRGPDQGKALMVFRRPSNFGGAVQAALYDGDTYIGTLSPKKHIAYQAEPGRRLFMVTGESADFTEAELLPDQTYYALIAPRVGVWKACFSFRPHNGQIDENDLQTWLRESEEVVPNEDGLAWSKENQARAMALTAEYLPKWMARPETDRQRLLRASGR